LPVPIGDTGPLRACAGAGAGAGAIAIKNRDSRKAVPGTENLPASEYAAVFSAT
jgi:hypothetical protein